MDNILEINGILLSNTALETLKRWQNSGSEYNPTTPERYVEYLNEAQDYLTRVMMEESKVENIAEILMKLICIKDDLKLLILKKQHHYEQK
ncbi:MAG: hypothetical protein E6772_17985 [Dysgonomonas sp.]|nr:hypothetical protein [Dysgonomonas sp.]